MIRLNISVDTRKVEAMLRQAQKQVPFALARALTMVAQSAAADVRTEMKAVFHNPIAYTLKGFYAKPARTSDLTAWVGARENAAKGTPTAAYISPQVFGGSRLLKPMERRIASQVGSSQYVMPGRGAQMDSNGNWSRGQIGQMLSRLNAEGDGGKSISATMTKRLRRAKLTVATNGHRSNYFVVHSKGNSAPIGIWRLVSKGVVEPVAIFALDAPRYSKRLDLQGVVGTSVAAHWSEAVTAAVEKALATAK